MNTQCDETFPQYNNFNTSMRFSYDLNVGISCKFPCKVLSLYLCHSNTCFRLLLVILSHNL